MKFAPSGQLNFITCQLALTLDRPGRDARTHGRPRGCGRGSERRGGPGRASSAGPSGKTYEAWVIRGGKATPAGTIHGSDGTTDVEVEGRVPRGSIVAITVERSGGVSRPTQKPLAATGAVS